MELKTMNKMFSAEILVKIEGSDVRMAGDKLMFRLL